MKRKYDEGVKSYLLKSHGDRVDILNERIK